jgi:hypothetical protein
MNVVTENTRVVMGAADRIRAAQDLLQTNRAQGLAVLNEIFRSGQPPDPPLDGAYDGELVALESLGFTVPFARAILAMWLPWRGKYLVAAESRGDNIFTSRSRWLFRLLYPFYRGVINGDGVFRALRFTTSIKAGMIDTDRQVLNINYDSPDNPALTIRPIIDELVQVHDGVYLGKIHFHWWWGRWQMIGYFSLRAKSGLA